MSKSKVTRLSVSVVFIAVFVSFSWETSYADGKTVFNAKNCGECHQVVGPNTDKTFGDKLKHKGPDLWFAGSKFKKEWLEGWIEKPSNIRLLKYNSVTEKNTGKHPTLSKKEAQEVAGYLMTLKAEGIAEGTVKEAATPQGRNLFIKRYGCTGCHAIKVGAQKTGGVSGPDLSEAGKRLKGDWVYAYLKNPDAFIPVKRMPTFAGIMNDNDMKILAGFVASQK